MRVLTINLWGRRGDWEARRAVLVEALRELRPDLVALQEAVVTEEYDQAADLLGPDFQLAHQTERELGEGDVERGQGASIAGRWTLGEVRDAARLRPRALRRARRADAGGASR
jgi:endonuclease/exonuclease/phosphatase family metal-dependent hydrolase